MDLVFTSFAFFILTMVASYIFYQRIKLAQAEYDDSKQTVRGITMVFTRQVKKMETELVNIERETLQAKYLANQAIRQNRGTSLNPKDSQEITQLNNRVQRIEENIDTMKQELTKLASQPRAAPRRQNDVAAPIPVQGADILQQITETELDVLRIIVDLGEGSVPDIRDKIGKTREHTSRLLKKLYDNGYIDRNTSSMPYRYHIRPEIKGLIIEKTEPQVYGL